MFQRAMDVNLSTAKWQFALAYLKDIIILSKLASDCLLMYPQYFNYCPMRFFDQAK